MEKHLTKRQHWNPRMHLRHFAINGKIYVYDKKTMKVKLISIKDAAVGKWFYGRDNSIENILSKIESKVARIFSKIIKTKGINNITLEERKNLNEFMVLQDYRTPNSRNQYEIIYQESLRVFISSMKNGEIDENSLPDGKLKEIWKNMPPPKENFIKFLQMIKEDPDYFAEFNRESAIRVTNMIISGSLPSGIELFSKLKLRLFENASNVDFYTSDHPLCRYNQYMMNSFGHITINGIGYNSEGIQFFYPVTPKLCLVFEDGKTYEMYEDVTTVDHEFVNFVNARIIQNSKQWIYSQNDKFSYVDDYLGDFPHFRNPDILFGLWSIPRTDSERTIWERFYGIGARGKLKKYTDYLIQKGATEREVEEIYTKYDLEYKMALENGKQGNS